MAHDRIQARLVALFFFSVLGLAVAQPSHARRGEPPRSRNLAGAKALGAIAQQKVAAVSASKLLAEDALAPRHAPLRFADPLDVSIRPLEDGTTEVFPDGSTLWRLRVEAPGATDLNFGFTSFVVPPGTTLHVSSEDFDYYEGPYEAADVEEHRQLWTPPVPGDRAVLEVYFPAGAGDHDIHLTTIGRGYRDLLKAGAPVAAKSGTCNNDVACPEGDDWRDEIRSVAGYSFGGSLFCTGTLIMDAESTFRPFFLTAAHCGLDAGNAPSLVVFWNFESPTCGQQGGGSLADNQSGAVWRAENAAVDMSLVELDDTPDDSFGVHYAGWDRLGSVPSGSVGIHHPNGDEKAISFNTDALATIDSCIGTGGVNSHWLVNNWEDGTTEPGSSGSGLWDSVTHRLVGFLSGGSASCSNPGASDCYGKFSEAWDGVDAASRLRDWLDPGDTGVVGVDGSDPSPRLLFDARTLDDLCAHDAAGENGVIEPGEDIEIFVSLRATGDFTGISATLTADGNGVSVIDDFASWPDIAAGSKATQVAPFRIRLARTKPCLSDFGLSLTITANEGGPFITSFTESVGAGLDPDVPLAIPDNSPSGGASQLLVAESETISDLDVRIEINHTYVGDLRILLRSPLGTEVVLLDQPGVPGSGFGCGDNNMDVVFDDASGFDPESYCSGSNPWYVGTAAPVGSLADFNGEATDGTWTLVAIDNAGADTGTIVDWELLTTPAVSGICTVCSDGSPTTTTTTSSTTSTTLPSGCPDAPVSGCLGGARALLLVVDKFDDQRDKILWKLARGAAFEQADLGDPVGTTEYRLCIYDTSDGVASLAAELTVPPDTDLWRSKDPKGFDYKDRDGSQDGVTGVKIRTGTAGRSKLDMKAGGASLPTPPPFGGDAFFAQDPNVIVQLIASDGAACWTTIFNQATRNTGDVYKAKVK
jgi:subtilisin-like proprotein convertase family protein